MLDNQYSLPLPCAVYYEKYATGSTPVSHSVPKSRDRIIHCLYRIKQLVLEGSCYDAFGLQSNSEICFSDIVRNRSYCLDSSAGCRIKAILRTVRRCALVRNWGRSVNSLVGECVEGDRVVHPHLAHYFGLLL